MEDLYIDRHERDVCFLQMTAGGFLGMGEKNYQVPVEAVTEVAADRVTIEPDRTEKVDGSVPFDTKVAPPPTDEPPDAYAWLPYGNAESPTDRLTSRYRTSTGRTSGRRVGIAGLMAAETDPSPATSGGTYAGFYEPIRQATR